MKSICLCMVLAVAFSFMAGWFARIQYQDYHQQGYPAFDDDFKGVIIGACVATMDDLPEGQAAHAHNCTTDILYSEYYGWLCFTDIDSFLDNFWHEYTHTRCPDQLHTQLFWDTLEQLEKGAK